MAAVVLIAVSAMACGQPSPAVPASSTIGASTTTAPPSPDGATVGAEPSEPEPEPAVTWTRCGEFECGTVSVPLRYGPSPATGDHTSPPRTRDSTVELAVLRKPATGVAVGTIFVNPGGPGASGIDFLRSGFDLGPEVGSRYDLVGFDPRGVGASQRLACGPEPAPSPRADSSPDNDRERRRLTNEAAALARQCSLLDQPLLSTMSTSVVAHDLEQLRRAVGDERLHYYGLSYGTLLGLRYAQLHPETVGRMVLDGVVDPALDLQAHLRRQALAFEQAFTELDGRCGTQDLPRCPTGGITAAYDRLLLRLETDGAIDGLGPTEATYAALIAMYSPGMWSTLAQGLIDADDDSESPPDGAELLALHDRLVDSVPFSGYAAYLCQDSPTTDARAWRTFADALQARAPRFGATVANELLTCAYWPATGVDRPGPIEAAGSEPILVIGTTIDPATPLINAQRVADRLDNGHLLVVEGFHHTAVGYNRCAAETVRSYLLDGRLPPAGSRC